MSDICCLYSLQVLALSCCKIDEGGILSEIWLVELHLHVNRFRSIPTWISQLSMPRILDSSHCLGLVQIPWMRIAGNFITSTLMVVIQMLRITDSGMIPYRCLFVFFLFLGMQSW